MIRTIKLKNPKLLKLLKENEAIAEDINKIVEEWQKKDLEVKKMSTKMERLKEKIRPMVAEELKKVTEIGEFEVVTSSKLDKDQVTIDIIDQVESYKDQLRKQKDGLPEDTKD
jgi:hypothetical protein